MIFREATTDDIGQIQNVRRSVKENRLSDPSLVSDEDCRQYLTVRGKGWICEADKKIIGFSIADLKDHNIWALFVRPEYEGKGIGKELHRLMLDWYFGQTQNTVWLSTAPGTRAENFYKKAGWKKTGLHGKGEIRFEMNYEDWEKLSEKGLKVGNAVTQPLNVKR